MPAPQVNASASRNGITIDANTSGSGIIIGAGTTIRGIAIDDGAMRSTLAAVKTVNARMTKKSFVSITVNLKLNFKKLTYHFQ